MRVIKLTLAAILVISALAAAGELNFSEFQYITNYETTIFGEKIKFFAGDTLWGWVHSNDQIAIMQSPVFYGPVTTAASTFWQGMGYNPQFFLVEPVFNYSTAEFPEELTSIRDAATEQGRFCALTGYQFRLIFQGPQGCLIKRWPVGMPYSDSLAVYHCSYPQLTDGAIFFDSDLQVLATDPENQYDYRISGRYSVGASGNIKIVDNLMYADVINPVTGQVDSSTNNCLGLASEQNILIANTWENGRDDGGNLYPNDPWRNSVALNGAFLALGESFSFEDQNDVIELSGYVPEWYISNGSTPDERGEIHLWGTIAQYRRGYVHRANHGVGGGMATGYLKDYHYYSGISENPPPYFPALEIELDFEDPYFDYEVIEEPGIFEVSMEVYNWSMDTIEVYGINASHPSFSGNMVPADTILPNDTALVTLTFEPDSNGYYEENVNIITNYEGDYSLPVYAWVTGLAVKGMEPPVPGEFRLNRVFPNPFNSAAVFEFENSGRNDVEISIFDISGRTVHHEMVNFDSGTNYYTWEPDNFASGLYFFRVRSGADEVSGKLLYLR